MDKPAERSVDTRRRADFAEAQAEVTVSQLDRPHVSPCPRGAAGQTGGVGSSSAAMSSLGQPNSSAIAIGARRARCSGGRARPALLGGGESSVQKPSPRADTPSLPSSSRDPWTVPSHARRRLTATGASTLGIATALPAQQLRRGAGPARSQRDFRGTVARDAAPWDGPRPRRQGATYRPP